MDSGSCEGGRARQLRFLVVDDYEDIREVFCRFIERAGHLASTASDGQEAVEVLQQESFDVMLLDFTMPRMDGAAVVRWLRAHPDVAPAMRVVVVTAWAVNHRETLAELGVETVLEKPLSMQRLNELIARTEHDLASSTPVV
jgi:CheY-like chemotaxis protein